MLTLRFQRVGKNKDYTFRVVAIDSRFSSKSGKVKEILGWWDPKKDKFSLKSERIHYWLKNGAQLSDSCYNLLVKAKLIEGHKRPIIFHRHKKDEAKETSKDNITNVKSEEQNNDKT